MLSAFRARTGRNQPSNTHFIFGPAVWLRSLIRPKPGFGLAYVDWSQQEFGIAAALSGDAAMLSAYTSGDPYLEFAKQCGAAPLSATKHTHGLVREQFKSCVLATQYGMEADALADRIGSSPAHARALLDLHRRTYRSFWRWSDTALDHAMLHGFLHTAFGWTIHVGPDATGGATPVRGAGLGRGQQGANPRSLRNFLMQGNGAEMLRLACCFATEHGVAVCAPVHDALLIEAPLEQLHDAVLATESAMGDASAAVLGGLRLRSDAKVIRHPERFADPRGKRMWDTVWRVIGEQPWTAPSVGPATSALAQQDPCAGAPPLHLISG
jgi:DNA polymerase I-like protein with 3'-5' exonuclease and polymerase domains